jgi:Zn-dependent protease with chaperone function
MVGLVGLLIGVAALAGLRLGLPLWFPAAFALASVLLQYSAGPWLIRKLVAAQRIPHDGAGYATDHPVGDIVARACRAAGVPLVTLGIVDDGTPNAFTFGHRPADAHVWLTRGLLERLDDDELEAVVAHEIGHIKNWDFVVMTVAAAVPLFLYLLYVTARGNRRGEGALIAGVAYVAYLVSQFVLLALSRARELSADHWSCASTHDGDALASALLKVAYGMGTVRAEQQGRLAVLRASGKEGKKEANGLERDWRRVQSLHALGIFDGRQTAAVEAALAGDLDPQRVRDAMQWELVSPWATTLEKFSSHPLVVRRIEALERSGLPGAPSRWAVTGIGDTIDGGTRSRLRSAWAIEILVAVAPWVVLAASVAALPTASLSVAGAALVLAGGLFLAKQTVRYPTRFEDVAEVTDLLGRLEANPVRGIPVVIRGRVVGRGTPGYVLSPDLVVQDASGFVPLLYRQPLPFARAWFGLARVQRFIGTDVVARGWYRRVPSPVVELRSVVAVDGPMASCWEWVARYAGSALVVAVGLVTLAASATG